MRFLAFCILALVSIPCLAQDATSKWPVPDTASRNAAFEIISSLYRSDYENAKTSQQKKDLARKLLSVGKATKDDQAGKFVLLRIARDLAAQQRDTTTSFESIEALSDCFNVDPLKMKHDAVSMASKEAKGYLDHQVLADALLPCYEEAIDTDQFDIAKAIGELALNCATEGRSPERVDQIEFRLKQLGELSAAYEQMKAAQQTLDNSPNNGDANSTVGRYLCLMKGNWEDGLPFLAKGSDERLKTSAEFELSTDVDPIQVADQWWEISDKLTGLQQLRAKSHSGEWYRKALPSLSGLSKVRTEQRLRELNVDTMPGTLSGSESDKTHRFAIQFDGKQSFAVVPTFHYDGTQPITVEARILCSDAKVSFPLSLSNGKDGLSVQVDPRNWHFSVGTKNGPVHVPAGPIKLDKWIHFAGVFTGDRALLFIDGKLRNSKPVKGSFLPANAPLLLGAKKSFAANETFYFRGQLKEVRISRSAKYMKDFPVPERLEVEKDTVLLLPFVEGSKDIARDASKYDHTAKLSNCTWVP